MGKFKVLLVDDEEEFIQSLAERFEARRLGAFDYMEKPVDIEILVSSMKAAYRETIEKTMTATAFAEAGEFGTAKNLIQDK